MNELETKIFLKGIYDHQTGGKLVFHAFKDDQAKTYAVTGGSVVGEWTDWVNKHEADGWGIHLRQGRMYSAATTSTKKDVQQICHLWLDIDRPFDKVSFVENQKDPLPEPTFIFNSGGGVHMYWRLDTPAEGIRMIEAEELNRKLANYFAADPGPTHMAATLRLPGTLNHKYDPPVPVSILRHNLQAETSIDLMFDWLKRNEDPIEAFADSLLNHVRQPTDWKSVLENLAVEGSANEFGGRNNCVTKLAGWWAKQGIDPATQLRTLTHHGCTLSMREMEGIVNRMYEKEHGHA